MYKHKDQEVHKNSSSLSSSCSSDDHIIFNNPFIRNKISDSLPPEDPQSISFVSDSSASQSPAPGGYELSRIPSSIFSIPANATEWSIASNESLFSIQIGNNSFARDHAFMIFKSGELTFAKNEELPAALPPVEETDNVSAVSNEAEEESNGAIESLPINLEAAGAGAAPPPVKTSNSSTSICVSPHSDDGTSSNHSTLSFAFQVFPGDERKNNPVKERSEKRNVQIKIEEHKLMESPVADMKVEVQPKVSTRRRWFCRLCRCRRPRPSCCSLL